MLVSGRKSQLLRSGYVDTDYCQLLAASPVARHSQLMSHVRDVLSQHPSTYRAPHTDIQLQNDTWYRKRDRGTITPSKDVYAISRYIRRESCPLEVTGCSPSWN